MQRVTLITDRRPRRLRMDLFALVDWLDIWGPRAGLLALIITVMVLVWLVPTLDAMGQAALRSCGL